MASLPSNIESTLIVAYNFKPGSLHIDLAIELYKLVQQLFPFMLPVGATGLWSLAKQSYNFVKVLTELRFKGHEPVVKEDNSVQSFIIGDNNHIIVNPTISINADKIEESISKIAGLIRPGAIDQLILKDPDQEGISITEEEKSFSTLRQPFLRILRPSSSIFTSWM